MRPSEDGTLNMPCLLLALFLLFPRVALVLLFFFTHFLERAYHSLLILVLGFIFCAPDHAGLRVYDQQQYAARRNQFAVAVYRSTGRSRISWRRLQPSPVPKLSIAWYTDRVCKTSAIFVSY